MKTKNFLNFVKDDVIRTRCYGNGLADFILQDVVKCIEDADLFLKRNYREIDYNSDLELIWALGRMVTLIMHPGLLTPTKEERCMQIAMTAKLNSGCLSRKVGAVITDSEYNILSLGWNDAPCGAESCIRRNLFDLIRNYDRDAYSEYECYNDEFREYLNKINSRITEDRKSNLNGLPFAFCFKDMYQDILAQKDQIYTRALHGEERAIVACKSDKIKGGYLFTTSSPCELCAKKIKEAGIKKIYYIEQYKGISQSHIINIGKERTDYILFSGATGIAYVRLYTPLMPYKDELKAYGYEPAGIHKEEKNDVKIIDTKTIKEKFIITDEKTYGTGVSGRTGRTGRAGVSMFSRDDIKKAICEGHLKIFPYDERNITGAGYNLSTMNFAFSIRKHILLKINVETLENGNIHYVNIPPNDTVLFFSKEYIETDNEIAGIFMSKVARVCQGLVI